MKAGWQTKTLGDVLDIRNGKNQREVESADGEYPIFGSAGNVMGYATSYICKAGATIVGRKGNINTPIFTETNFWNVDTAFGLEAKSELDSRFLYYFCLSYDFSIHNRGTTIPSLVKSDLLQIKIQIPPIPEQQRIIGILDAAFDGIATAKATAEQNLQNARALFESHLQSVFTQRGEGWVEKRLGDICERVSVGHVGPTSAFYCNTEEGIPFLRSQNVRRGFLDWDGLQYVTKEFHKKLRKSQLYAGDLLFVRVGANRGDCCSVPSELGELNCANIVFARPTEGNATYLERYCDSTHGREQLLGMTTGSAQGVINTSSVAELIVPLPPTLEQKRIVDSLNEMQAETQRLESLYQRKLAALAELKKSLLHQAFSGVL